MVCQTCLSTSQKDTNSWKPYGADHSIQRVHTGSQRNAAQTWVARVCVSTMLTWFSPKDTLSVARVFKSILWAREGAWRGYSRLATMVSWFPREHHHSWQATPLRRRAQTFNAALTFFRGGGWVYGVNGCFDISGCIRMALFQPLVQWIVIIQPVI
jgi:hypothetical protein